MYPNIYTNYSRVFEPIPSIVFEPDVEYPQDIYRSEHMESEPVETEAMETQLDEIEEYMHHSENEDTINSSCVRTENIEQFKKSFTIEETQTVAEKLGINFSTVEFDIEQFRMGLDVELEHGMKGLNTNITDDDPVLTGKIALAHLNEIPNYYTRLAYLEAQAKNILNN